MSDEKVRQHVLPKCYLRQFSYDSEKGVYQYDKSTERVFSVALNDSTVEKRKYSFLDAKGKWDHRVEDFLGEIESRAAPILREFDNPNQLQASEREDFSQFIALMARRHLAHAEAAKAVATQFFKGSDAGVRWFEEQLEDLSGRFSDEEIESQRKKFAAGEFPFDPERSFKAAMLQTWIRSVPQWAQLINRMGWEVVKAPPGYFFITADVAAYVRRRNDFMDQGIVGINRSDLGAELTFPLSSSTALIATHDKPDSTRVASKTEVVQLNRKTARMANRWVIAYTDSDRIREIVREFKHVPTPLPNFELED